MRKYFFILETVLGFGIFILINFSLFRDSQGFIDAVPHPYWALILLIAVRYGTLQGLFAGSVAAGLYIITGSLSGQLDFSMSSFPHGPFKMPFLFMLVGGLLGEIRLLYKKRFEKLEDKYQETVDELQDLGVQYLALNESKEELDKRIAFQSNTMLTLLEQIYDLEKLDTERLFERIPALLEQQLNIESGSLYLIDGRKLHLKSKFGKRIGALPETIGVESGIVGEVIREKRVITIREITDEDELDRFDRQSPIMSAPIIRKNESVIGVINIEKIPFFEFNATTVRIFEMLAYWISILVEKSMQFQKLQDKNIDDEITGAYNYPYFRKRLSYEIARAKRFNSPLSLVLLDIGKFESMTRTERFNVLVVLNTIFKNTLREIDLIFKYKEQSMFAIILPGQMHKLAEGVVERLMREINSFELRPFENKLEFLTVKHGVSTLQYSEGSYISLIQSAEERLEQGGKRNTEDIFEDIDFLLNEK